MLRSVLSPETCAACRNCCIFEEQSAWELPTFLPQSAERLQDLSAVSATADGARIRIALSYDETHTARHCPFLNPDSGCTLPADEKPFACSIWPVRVMRRPDGAPGIALYQGCPGMPKAQEEALCTLLENGLRARILAETAKDASLILPYHPNYRFLDGKFAELYPEPAAVYRYFAELSALPHGSGNTGAIRQWALDTAARLHLSAYADETGNVIIRKDASPGYEEHPRVILQGHMDMVCAKLPDCRKDMETEGLTLCWTDEYLSAEGTTLGGDDGIAVAYAFAVLESDRIAHPPLTVILTVDEETGMDGATGLSADALDGTYLINIDSEEEGIFTVGCAGGVRVHLQYPLACTDCSGTELTLTLSGLQGGHSGAEIHKPLLNANTAMLRLLLAAKMPFRLAGFSGGVLDNVIPSECSAVLVCKPESAEQIAAAVRAELSAIRSEYPSETGIRLEIHTQDHCSGMAVSETETADLLAKLRLLPNGVQCMNETLHMPETSLNLGIFSLHDGIMHVDALIRSGINAEKEKLARKLEALAARAGGTSSESGNYPAWEYRESTTLEQTAAAVFEKCFGRQPVIQTIHAGLECGILSDKAPGLQCISIGPDLFDIHTPRERLSLPSAQRTWEFLLALLKAL
ncbi:MAG: aminoacyl-histidine dipeptidase [Oscillospiraceae bacterium]|nr:aminoacyl-histidine dipeptidase [Oscillospiraceae bacterium]